MSTLKPFPDDDVSIQSEKNTRYQSPASDWGSDAANDVHLWCRTSASGDFCFISNDDDCARHGPRLKCSSCKVIVHQECVHITVNKFQVICRPTFQDASATLQRESISVGHHWIPRRSEKGRCQHCYKTFQSKLPFGGKDLMAMSCTWCKIAFHNKKSCFNPNIANGKCELGYHAGIIVPPTWIFKLPPNESEINKLSFAIKPIPSPSSKPLLIFINPKSGGNQGDKLMRTFQWLLNPRQVFDLTEGGPKIGLDLYRKVPNLRILACGGDGTVGWILSTLDDLEVTLFPPIAVLPLGTGNDLARTLGWGGGYTDEPISKILSNVEDGEIVKLDRWILKVNPNSQADLINCEEGRAVLPMNVVNNYFSLGVDALIALEFHEAREARPDKFSSRFWNKMFYGQAGGKDLIQRKWKDLCNYVTLECDGKDITYKLKDLKVHSILFLNISSYGGGTTPWGSPVGKHYQMPKTDDGKIEVIGLTTYQLPLLQAGGHGSSIAQCSTAKLETRCTVPVQIDGEPCRLKPSVIEIGHWNTVNMVAKTKKHEKAVKVENVQMLALRIQKLNLVDYETHHHQHKQISEKAVNVGSLTVSFDADLADIRSKVHEFMTNKNPASNEKENFQPEMECKVEEKKDTVQSKSNWWFLDSCTAENFYRIDKAQEHLYYAVDICEGDLYVLTEEKPAIEVVADDVNVIKSPDVDEVETDVSHESSTSSSSVHSPPSLSSSRDDRSEVAEDDLMTAAMMGGVVKVARFHSLGKDLTATDRDGRTILHHAAFIGNVEVVEYLAFYGPRILLDMQDNVLYHTALHRAATRRDRIVCSILVCAGASLCVVDKQGLKAQQLAALVGDKILAEYLKTMENPVIL